MTKTSKTSPNKRSPFSVPTICNKPHVNTIKKMCARELVEKGSMKKNHPVLFHSFSIAQMAAQVHRWIHTKKCVHITYLQLDYLPLYYETPFFLFCMTYLLLKNKLNSFTQRLPYSILFCLFPCVAVVVKYRQFQNKPNILFCL